MFNKIKSKINSMTKKDWLVSLLWLLTFVLLLIFVALAATINKYDGTTIKGIDKVVKTESVAYSLALSITGLMFGISLFSAMIATVVIAYKKRW